MPPLTFAEVPVEIANRPVNASLVDGLRICVPKPSNPINRVIRNYFKLIRYSSRRIVLVKRLADMMAMRGDESLSRTLMVKQSEGSFQKLGEALKRM